MFKIFSRRKVDSRAELHKVLGDFELPTFPAVVLSALERVRDDEAPLSETAEIVARDPGLSVRLLGAVNSATFALRHRVNSVSHAVSLLGRGEVESILISMAVREAMPQRNTEVFDRARFWTASARRAATARALADRIDPSTASESFTAALLQDMALPILATRRAADYGPLLDQWRRDGEDLVALERAHFEWDHPAVGTWMCEHWKLPESLAEAIAAHHGTCEDLAGLPAVNLVSALGETDDPGGAEELIETAHARYGLDCDETRALMQASFEQAEELARLFA